MIQLTPKTSFPCFLVAGLLLATYMQLNWALIILWGIGFGLFGAWGSLLILDRERRMQPLRQPVLIYLAVVLPIVGMLSGFGLLFASVALTGEGENECDPRLSLSITFLFGSVVAIALVGLIAIILDLAGYIKLQPNETR